MMGLGFDHLVAFMRPGGRLHLPDVVLVLCGGFDGNAGMVGRRLGDAVVV